MHAIVTSMTRIGAMIVLAMGLTARNAEAAFVASQTLNDPSVTSGDQFGTAVAIHGNNVLIGDRFDDTSGTNVGRAHLFDATAGSLLRTFDDPTVTSGDEFGFSVAVQGSSALVGAPGDATNGSFVGQAHLFDTVTGNLLQTFNDPTVTGTAQFGSGDQFGFSVAVQGNNILIGAPADDTNGSRVGQAHLFDAVTGNLVRTFDDPTPTGTDEFGFSVDIDGNNVLIGARNDDSNGTNTGQAHLFDISTGSLLQTFDEPTATNFGQFGSSVAIDGGNILISAPLDGTNGSFVGQVHLFDVGGNLLHTFDDPTVTGVDQFGSSVALDGDNVLIGARFDDSNGSNVGQAHLFDAATGNLLQTFDDPAATGTDQFGLSVGIDGGTLVIGAPLDDTNGTDVGQAHLFTQAVPAPGSLILMLAGAALLPLRRWRF